MAEDGDLFMRILEAEVPFVILNTPTLYYRRHGDSMMTRDDPRKKSDLVRVARHVTRAPAEIRPVARPAIVRPLLRGSSRAQVDMMLVVIGAMHKRRFCTSAALGCLWRFSHLRRSLKLKRQLKTPTRAPHQPKTIQCEGERYAKRVPRQSPHC